MKLYLAGPMSGIPQFNYPAFKEGAEFLRGQGYDVINPAEMDDPAVQKASAASTTGTFDAAGTVAGHTWGDFLSRDVKIVADEVDGVALLPGWYRSRGARLEAFVCLNVQKPIYLLTKNSHDDLVMEVAPNHLVAESIKNNTLYQTNAEQYGKCAS